jgi:hypothetical protein
MLRQRMKTRILVLALSLLTLAESAYAQADLAVTLEGGDPDVGCIPELPPCNLRVHAGGRAGFSALVKNVGPSTANDVVVTLSFPPLTTVAFAFPTSSCAVSNGSGHPVVVCSFPSVPVTIGDPVVVTVILNVASTYLSPFLTASATVESSTSDPVVTNNSATLALRTFAQIPTLKEKTLALLAIALAILALAAIRSA